MIRNRCGPLARRLLLLPGLAVVVAGTARGQGPATPGVAAVGPGPAPAPVVEAAPEAPTPALPPQIQVVQLQAPQGVKVEVLAPPPEVVPAAKGPGTTVGLRVGVAYRLRLSNFEGRHGAELYPTIEVVGHLHRPSGIDPSRFPIRVVFGDEDIEETVAAGRLVTQVVYLEDPEQALPINLPKSEIPRVTLSPVEDPLRVAPALGRVMAVVRVGGRAPTVDEFNEGAATTGLVGAACPFVGPEGARCPLPCGPVRGTAPPAGRPWIPADEYLCDGGDHAEPAHFGGDGGLRGIDPRDALIQFRRPTPEQLMPELDKLRARFDRGEISAETFGIEARRLDRAAGAAGTNRPRVLPTNMVCIYAPRFAAVRSSVGPNETTKVDVLKGHELIQGQAMNVGRTGPLRMAQNQAAEANRHRQRPSAMRGRVYASSHIEVRVLAETDTITHIAGFRKEVIPESVKERKAPAMYRLTEKAVAIKTVESAVVTGLVQGPNETVMAWKPQELAGVEEPPNKPGLAVVKRVSVDEAEPGDVVTFTIQYRNMGNTPIASVSVIDSLLPRLEYVRGSARGPAGAVFTATENRVGSTELRWDLPGVVAPGTEGIVAFQVRVRSGQPPSGPAMASA